MCAGLSSPLFCNVSSFKSTIGPELDLRRLRLMILSQKLWKKIELNKYKTYMELCDIQNEIMFPTQPGWSGHCLWKPWPGIVSQ